MSDTEPKLTLRPRGPAGVCTHCGRDNHDSIDCYALWASRRIQRLREGIATAQAHSNPRLIYLALAEAIEADDRQETKVELRDSAIGQPAGTSLAPVNPEQPYRPKPGERAKLLSSPCNGDFEFLDYELEILDVRKPSDPHYLPREHYACRAESAYPDRPLRVDIHRDATWEPLPPTAERPPEAGEPTSDDENGLAAGRAFVTWLQSVQGRKVVYQAETFSAGYEAGRAREAKRWHDQNTTIMRDHEDTQRKWAADVAELERVRGELERFRSLYKDECDAHGETTRNMSEAFTAKTEPGQPLGTARLVYRGKAEPRRVELDGVDETEAPSPLPENYRAQQQPAATPEPTAQFALPLNHDRALRELDARLVALEDSVDRLFRLSRERA